MSMRVEPFMFEPEYEDYEDRPSPPDSDDSSEGEAAAVQLPERMQDTTWCSCMCCSVMPSVLECLCCREIGKGELMSGEACISTTERFQTICLDTDVLTINLLMIHDTLTMGPLQRPIPTRSLRLAAYRAFVYWVWGKLGHKNRRPIPACVVKSIREAYPEPSGVYEGFHEADL